MAASLKQSTSGINYVPVVSVGTNMPSSAGSQCKNMYRTSVLVLLGLILISPFMWVKLDGSKMALTVVASVSTLKGSSEYADRMLLGTNSNSINGHLYPSDSNKPCMKPKKSHSVPELESIHEWVSDKSFERESVTLLTQLSIDRLSMLENQCQAWDDPLVAVVYVPLIQGGKVYGSESSLADITRGVSSFFSLMEGTSSCKLHIELVAQYIDNERTNPYPINALRNRAMKLAQTELIFVLDVDFVASPRLGLEGVGYKDPEVYNQLVNIAMNKKAIVAPAFELTNRQIEPILGENYAKDLAMSGKSAIIKGYKAGSVDFFNAHDAPWGHGPTNTSRWIRLSNPIIYKVKYEPKYEPFVILAKNIAPWADERFVGYGGNKIAYINQLKGMDFTFHVHPYAFSVHVPHHRTKAADIFVAHKKSGHSTIEELRVEVASMIKKGTYVPVVSACSDVEKA